MSLFTHPRVVTTVCCLDPIDFHSIVSLHYGSQRGPGTVWSPTFFKIYSFVLQKSISNPILVQYEDE